MSTRRIATALVVLSLAVPGWVAAQGLGDAAARERARREKEAQAKKGAEAKVFTNEDLTEGQPPGTPPRGEGGSSTASPPGPATEAPPATGVETRFQERSDDDEDDEDDRRGSEQPFLDAVTAAQSRLSETERRIQELQSKLNPMSGSFIYGATGSNSTAEEAEVRAELSRAEGELGAARQDLAAAVQAVQDFRQGRIVTPPAPR